MIDLAMSFARLASRRKAANLNSDLSMLNGTIANRSLSQSRKLTFVFNKKRVVTGVLQEPVNDIVAANKHYDQVDIVLVNG